jgi:hypothetical protein
LINANPRTQARASGSAGNSGGSGYASSRYSSLPDTTEIRDMHDPAVAAAASYYGIRRLPAVVVDGRLADCYAARDLDEATLTQAIFG